MLTTALLSSLLERMKKLFLPLVLLRSRLKGYNLFFVNKISCCGRSQNE
jgi:hypothetical protein